MSDISGPVQIDMDAVDAERARLTKQEAKLMAQIDPLQIKLHGIRRQIAALDAQVKMASEYR